MPIVFFFQVRGFYAMQIIGNYTILPKSIKLTDLVCAGKVKLKDHKIHRKKSYSVIFDDGPFLWDSWSLSSYNEVLLSKLTSDQIEDVYIIKHDDYQRVSGGAAKTFATAIIFRDSRGNRIITTDDSEEENAYFDYFG